jgi:Na+-translocating ferredoxin:NAD+ oxidoreductase subunit G
MPEASSRPWPPFAQIALAVVLLALAAIATRDSLREQARASALAAFAGVLPASYYDNDPAADRIEVSDADALGSAEPLPLWRARRGGEASALVVDAIASGYGGPLRLRIGIARDGSLLGVRVIEHRETRGLGDAFAHDGGRWLAQFAGRSLDDPPASRWAVRRNGGEFDQFSQATVTPHAILARVKAVLAAYAVQHERWFVATAVP